MKWFVLIAALAFTGCASSQKNTSETNTTPAAVQAAAPVSAASGEEAKLSCTKGDETRTLQVVRTDGGCDLDYVKEGKMKAVASSTHGVHHCLHAKKKIRAKLEKAGYTCE